MSALLGHKGDRQPFTCTICGRNAQPYGYCSPRNTQIAWVCDNPACLPLAKEVYSMDGRKLDIYERRAVEGAGTKIFDALAETILNAMWSKGVRNLEEMDAEKFIAVAAEAQASPEFKKAMTDFLIAYGASIREQISTGMAPF